MNIKTPAIFLSFDDSWVKEWHKSLSLFDSFRIKVTFYFSFGIIGGSPGIPYQYMDDDWRMFREMQEQGHTIGYHTWGHLDAVNVLKDKTLQRYVEMEIDEGLEIMGDNGLDVRHFCYPYGSHTEELNRELLKIFNTVRIAVKPHEMIFYDADDLEHERAFISHDIKEPETVDIIQRVIRENKVAFLFAHCPQLVWNKLIKLLEIQALNFYPMSILNR